MMIARFKVPMPHYQEAKQLQAQVLQSFKLVKPNNERVEKLKTYGFLSESYFDYPETWSLLPSKIRTIERMQAKLALGQNLQRLDGQMGFFLSANDTNKTTLKKEVRDFKESFKVNDYKLSDFIERVEIDYNEEMDFGATEVYRMEPTISSKIEYELWVTILQNERYNYIVTLLTPARDADLYKWARNRVAYEAVVGSFRLKNEDSTVGFGRY